MEDTPMLNAPPSLLAGSTKKDKCDENEEIEHNLCENENNEGPGIGMIFNSKEEVHDYYTKYAQRVGFGIVKRSQKLGDYGELRYFSLECSRGGKRRIKSNKPLNVCRTTKTKCKARIRATLQPDQKFMLTTVVLEHNHDLSPGKVLHFRCNRKFGSRGKKRIELNVHAGISACKNSNSLVVEDGGHDNLLSVEKERQSDIEKSRRLRLAVRDAKAIRKYFDEMQDKNSRFFYVIDFDEESHIRNLFWADARSRATYEAFGDVVSFDTTYLTNKYDMPIALFVGVNHHGQSVLLGCGLLSNEDTETFVWLFESWLACMLRCPPKAIITDQCKSVQKAVERVFPNARHRWCLWHVMKKIHEKLGGYSQYEAIKSTLQSIVYDSLTKDEFEEKWRMMIKDFDLYDNEWLEGLYDHCDRWVPVYVKDIFWAGMSTTRHSDSMNAFFDGYVNSKTTLKQFIEQYDNALRNKIKEEIEADFYSFNSVYDCLTLYDIEKQFQEVYTNAKFEEVQEEFKRIIYCRPSLIKEECSICTYEVTEDVKLGDRLKRAIFIVNFNALECEVRCMCRLFEFKGIVCGHSLSVLTQKQVKEVPPKYILSRWRKDLKREYTFVKTNYSDLGVGPNARWYNEMCKEFNEVAQLAVDSEEKRNIVLSGLQEIKVKVLNYGSLCGSNQSSPKRLDQSIMVSKESNKRLSPVVVHQKGRLPSEREVSGVEQVVRKVKEKRRKHALKKGQQDEALHTSRTPHMVAGIGTQESLNLMARSGNFFGCTSMITPPATILSQLPNIIQTQFWVSGSNQVCGGGYLNFPEDLSQAPQGSFQSSGYVGQNIGRHNSIENNSQDVSNALHPHIDH